MSCNAKTHNLCRLIQKSYKSPLLYFGDLDISADFAKLLIYNGFSRTVIEEIQGQIFENRFFFPEFTLPKNDYKYEIIWNHEGTNHLVVFGKYIVTDKPDPCGCGNNSDVINISINDGDTVINVEYSEVILGGGGSGNVSWDDITEKPSLFSGSYTDLSNKPTLFSGSYTDLTNKPSIPAAQVNSDWNAISGISQILNKPILFDGTWTSLTGKPSTFAPPVATSTVLGGVKIWTGIQSAYDAIATKATDVLYFIEKT